MAESWIDGPFLGFDTETTGTDPSSDKLVTAALVEWREGKTRSKTWLANPGCEIPVAAQNVHGISTEKAREEGADLQRVVEEVSAYIVKAAKRQIPLVIYNASFDLPLLNAHLQEFGKPDVFAQVDFLPVIDPLVLDRALNKYRKGPRKLVNLLDYYGIDIPENELHDALVDVKATILILRKIIAEYPEIGAMPLRELMSEQQKWYADWAAGINAYWACSGQDRKVSLKWINR